MDKIVLFVLDRETKGAVRYREVDASGNDAFSPVIGTLYIRKSAMTSVTIPKKVAVHLTGE